MIGLFTRPDEADTDSVNGTAGKTSTGAVTVVVWLSASVALTVTSKVPDSLKVCGTVTLPEAAPSDCLFPSSQSTVTVRMGALAAPGVTLNVKFPLTPTLGVVAGGVIVTVGTALAVIAAVPVLAPAVTVTVASWLVDRSLVARPSCPVVAVPGESVPVVGREGHRHVR